MKARFLPSQLLLVCIPIPVYSPIFLRGKALGSELYLIVSEKMLKNFFL